MADLLIPRTTVSAARRKGLIWNRLGIVDSACLQPADLSADCSPDCVCAGKAELGNVVLLDPTIDPNDEDSALLCIPPCEPTCPVRAINLSCITICNGDLVLLTLIQGIWIAKAFDTCTKVKAEALADGEAEDIEFCIHWCGATNCGSPGSCAQTVTITLKEGESVTDGTEYDICLVCNSDCVWEICPMPGNFDLCEEVCDLPEQVVTNPDFQLLVKDDTTCVRDTLCNLIKTVFADEIIASLPEDVRLLAIGPSNECGWVENCCPVFDCVCETPVPDDCDGGEGGPYPFTGAGLGPDAEFQRDGPGSWSSTFDPDGSLHSDEFDYDDIIHPCQSLDDTIALCVGPCFVVPGTFRVSWNGSSILLERQYDATCDGTSINWTARVFYAWDEDDGMGFITVETAFCDFAGCFVERGDVCITRAHFDDAVAEFPLGTIT
jgi:hypothetical protein